MNKKVLQLDYLQNISREIFDSSNPDVIEKKLSYVLDFYTLINYEFTYDQALWRGVRCETANGFSNINRVGYPPPSYAKAGRLNETGSPVLYVSINQFSVLEEIGAKEGDFVHVVAYKFNKGCRLRCGLVGEVTQVHRWGTALSSDSLGKELNRIMNEMSFDVGRSYVFTDSFLSSIFRDKFASNAEYVKSRILAKLLFDKLSGLEAIIYPSVAHEGAMNFAIKPDSADRKLSIGATFVVHVKRKYDYGIYDFEIIRRAEGQGVDGTIVWAAEK